MRSELCNNIIMHNSAKTIKLLFVGSSFNYHNFLHSHLREFTVTEVKTSAPWINQHIGISNWLTWKTEKQQ